MQITIPLSLSSFLIPDNYLFSFQPRVWYCGAFTIANTPNLRTSQEIVINVDASQDQAHGCVQVKTHNKSKVTSLNALEPRIAILEASMSAIEDTFDSLGEQADSLEREYIDLSIASKALIQD